MNWYKIWDLKNEPFSVVLSLVLLLLVIIFCFQYFVRKLPIYCDGNVLPQSSALCGLGGTVPVGTIVAFFGLDRDIPLGWIVCDGSDIEDRSIKIDADPEEEGNQVPDLRERFIRGSLGSLDKERVVTGGQDMIEMKHLHVWAHYTEENGGKWESFDQNGERFRVDDWGNGLHSDGRGEWPLAASKTTILNTGYTDEKRDFTDNRPVFTELRYIIKLR